MNAPRRLWFLFAFLFMAGCVPGTPGLPKSDAVPEYVYTGSIFDGIQYGAVLSPAEQDTLYLLADTVNAVVVKRTEVYFWEITQEYKADWEKLNQPLDGTLEIYQGNHLFQKLERQSQVLVRQYDSQLFKEIVFGPDALQRFQAYQNDIQRYRKDYENHVKAQQQYSEELWDRYQNPDKYRNVPLRKEPDLPPPLHEFVSEVALTYPLSLPVGSFTMRVVDSNGRAVPGSEKKLKTIQPRRKGISYVVYTEHRWTNQKTSREPEEVIYVGAADSLFLQPFVQHEYYADDYLNLTEPQKKHAPLDDWMWVDIHPLSGEKLQTRDAKNHPGERDLIPFQVQQLPGPKLGYLIVPVDPNRPESTPSFSAYKIDLARETVSAIGIIDQHSLRGGADRQIRRIANVNPLVMILPVGITLSLGLIAVSLRKVRANEPLPERKKNGHRCS